MKDLLQTSSDMQGSNRLFHTHTLPYLAFIWAPLVCAHEDVSRDFKFTQYNLPLSLYGRNNVNTLIYNCVLVCTYV